MNKIIGSNVVLSFTGKLIGVREDPFDETEHKRLLYKIQLPSKNFFKEEFEVPESYIVKTVTGLHPDDAIHLGGHS